MSATYPLSFYRRITRQLAARITSLRASLRGIRNQIVTATEQALQDLTGGAPVLVPIRVRTNAAQARKQRRSHD